MIVFLSRSGLPVMARYSSTGCGGRAFTNRLAGTQEHHEVEGILTALKVDVLVEDAKDEHKTIFV